MLRRTALDDVGLYDYIDFPTMLEEADLQTRIAKAGYDKAIVAGARALHEIPSDKWGQLRRYSPYKIEFLCRNHLILFRKFGSLTIPKSSALIVRYFLYYTFVAMIQPVSLRGRVNLLSAMGVGIIRGLMDPVNPSTNADTYNH